MQHLIQFKNYGLNLGSRLLGRKVISDNFLELKKCQNVHLDFQGVKFMSISFATEIIDSINRVANIQSIEFSANNPLIEEQVQFALKKSNSKSPDEATKDLQSI